MLKKMTSVENTNEERREENDRPRKRAKTGVLLKLGSKHFKNMPSGTPKRLSKGRITKLNEGAGGAEG